MRANAWLRLAIVVFASLAPDLRLDAVDYDIVYVRQARFGDDENTWWPEVFHPCRIDPGADLMLLHPDGSEEVLVEGGHGSVTDPFVSFDGRHVYYSLFHDQRREALNNQRGYLSEEGADIFRIHLETREIEQLTFGEFTPNTGAGNWDESNPVDPDRSYHRLGYGIFNLGPCPVPGGRIAFTSNRNGIEPTKGYTNPAMQIFVMDEDGSNVTLITPMTTSSVLHPTILRDGRLLFSTQEDQGLRDRRVWALWSIYPDGRQWNPVVSGFRTAQAFHFMTQLASEDVVVVDYYNLNNNGFGTLYKVPIRPPEGEAPFHSAMVDENPRIDQTISNGTKYWFRMPFTPKGMHSITPFTHGNDNAAPVGPDGETRVGKFTHPSGAPGDDLLVVWSPGPCNDLNRPVQTPRYDGGIYVLRRGEPIQGPDELILIKNDPAYNEAWPRAVVPYREVHGVDEPEELPWLPNDGFEHPDHLPEGTPYGLVGTSSFYKRESFPGYVHSSSRTFDGLDSFNTSQNGHSSNWTYQGSDAGLYSDEEIWAVRILALEPNTHRSYGPRYGREYSNHAGERIRILGEIPLRKTDAAGRPILDPDGHPDTSFLAKIPADTSFTFQTIDRDGLVLNMAQTWHQVRPGEARYDCGGCHAHSQQPLDFFDTAASRSDYDVADLSKKTPLVAKDELDQPTLDVIDSGVVNVEFIRDIRPIFAAHCVPCHTKSDANPPGKLVLDDYSDYRGLPGDYKRLADDQDADWGHPPMIPFGKWRQTNASRYVRKFQSRRSLLTWKIFGRRLDGWTNEDHPSAATPGDRSTLPPGTNPNHTDIDFYGTIMPPPDGGVPPLTAKQKMTIARWIDLGCPIDLGDEAPSSRYGWFLDDVRPTIALSSPRAGRGEDPLSVIRVGLADAYTGIAPDSLEVSASFEIDGRRAGAALEDLFVESGDGIWEARLKAPIRSLERGTLHVSAVDRQGNITRIDRTFSIDADPLPIFRRGDCNADTKMDISDTIFLLGYLFLAPEAPPRCFDACDTNDDSAVDMTDAIAVVNTLFLGAPPPPAPGTEDCGVDGADGESVGCAQYDGCGS